MRERKAGERGCKGYKGESKEVRRKGGSRGVGEAWDTLTLLPRPWGTEVGLKGSDGKQQE